MKKIFDIIKKNYIYILFTIFLMLVNISVIFTSADNEKEYILALNVLLTIVFGIIFSIIYKKMSNTDIKIEKLFLITVIPIAILYLFSFPYGTIMDEQNHFLRTYEIVDGHLISELNENGQGGDYLSASFGELPRTVVDYETQAQVVNVKENDEKVFYEFSNTALYSFICYIPQAIGVGLGKLLHLPFIFWIFLGRLTNFLVYAAIVYFAIKFLPFKKEIVYLISTLPITMQEIISLSPDALTIAMAIAIVSFTLYMIYTKKDEMSRIQITMMCIISIVLSMCKIVYLPLCLILFLIPKERFNSLKKKNIIIISLAVFIIILNLGWTIYASRYLDSHVHGSSSSEQIDYIVHKPYKLIPVIVETFNQRGSEIILTLFGARLGYYTINVFLPYIYLLIIIFIFSLFTDNLKEVKSSHKIMYGFIVFSVWALICLSLYIQWTPLMNSFIDGIQGRYFIPIMLLLSILGTNKKIEFKGKVLNNYTLLLILMINLSAISEIILKFA